jgi:HD-like signal output (HDOD) protein
MPPVDRHSERYGRGVVELEPEVELLDRNDLARILRAMFEAPDYRPPLLPPVALQLLALSHKPNAKVEEIAALLETDPLLAARVLKVVQSPLYAGDSPIRSIKQAIVRLGLRVMRDLVTEAAFAARILRVAGFSEALERTRCHSIATAHLARVVSRYTPIEADFAFLCGLLHDVGISCSLLALAELGQGWRPPNLELAWPTIDGLHEQASGHVARIWNLPAEVRHVVAHHHAIVHEGFVHPLSAVVCLAEQLAVDCGRGILAAGTVDGAQIVDASGAALLARAQSELRLLPAQLELIRKEAAQVVAKVQFQS